jgi:hypothetical protein
MKAKKRDRLVFRDTYKIESGNLREENLSSFTFFDRFNGILEKFGLSKVHNHSRNMQS